jgi:integrase
MSGGVVAGRPLAQLVSQPADVRGLPETERDALIITTAQVDGRWVVVSRYGDDIWWLDGVTSNVPDTGRKINFGVLPEAFMASMKAVIYRYMRRGRKAGKRPRGSALRNFFYGAKIFLEYLQTLNIFDFSAITSMACIAYLDNCRKFQQKGRFSGKLLSKRRLAARLNAVQAIYELSQFTDDPMLQEPWSGTDYGCMVGLDSQQLQGCKTPLIPDAEFCILFEKAYERIERGNALLDLRDSLDAFVARLKGTSQKTITNARIRYLNACGWEGGMSAFSKAMGDLRTSCYIVLASTSGCRNHELASLQSGAHHRTQDDEGTVYHWMRSRSDKTDAGVHDWMIPEVAVRALRMMERWAAPLQEMVNAEIGFRRRINALDPKIAELNKHRSALFLSKLKAKGNPVRTLSAMAWNLNLKAFAKDCGLDWNLTTHQFRRKFANYAAHSRFGDLRYLKEHFAHQSMDMTLGYAMDETWGRHLDLDLYMDIQGELEDIKIGIVDTWFGDGRLAGGYGESLKGWQRDPQNLLIFKDRASMLKSIAESTNIRSNGHAWCTADNDGCVGNTLERTRCGNGCNNAVIGQRHAGFYKQLYDHTKGLLDCAGIGESGRQRVLRDMGRCRDVLLQLGIDPEVLIA